MDRADRISIVAIPAVVLVAAVVAWAGSQGEYRVSGVPLFAFCVALVFVIQRVVLIPSFLAKSCCGSVLRL